jgi:lysyl-tRNA synthetase class 2
MADHDPLPDEPDSDQVEVRKQKLAKLKAAGVEPYPNDFKPNHSASEIVSTFADASDQALAEAPKDLRVAGRIVAIRRMGKASFFHIQDRRGRLQVYIQQNRVGEEATG